MNVYLYCYVIVVVWRVKIMNLLEMCFVLYNIYNKEKFLIII